MTKTLTATVILLLEEDGLLNLNDPIGLHINTNNMPYVDSTETIRQLLNHTSNITDILGI